ncbi:MAG: FeS-binding protein, partial [Flavobacteriaceae bacterium]|nr:FeS-binding protein [Flavobacteriaceae bacterium]
MKSIQKLGLLVFLVGLGIFSALVGLGEFELSSDSFKKYVKERGIKSEFFVQQVDSKLVEKSFNGIGEFHAILKHAIEDANAIHKKKKAYKKVIYTKPTDMTMALGKLSGKGFFVDNKLVMWLLTFGLGILGALLYIVPDFVLLGPEGIKNNGIYHRSATNKGWVAWLVFVYLVVFYLILYFWPQYAINWTYLVDPISEFLSGNPAGHWFVYGFLYCVIMLVMAVRMYIKYRHNAYQMVRTTSVLFFQVVFAFLVPEIMVRLQMPYYDFKNIFPLDYDFFFSWNIKSLINSGGIGIFILVWGIALTIAVVPVMVYFFGKRWYCSWVCGCGGLAETLG